MAPAKTPAAEVLKLRPDGVFLSNGQADPAAVTYAIENTRQLIEEVPLTGICLGHQIMALGGKTYENASRWRGHVSYVTVLSHENEGTDGSRD